MELVAEIGPANGNVQYAMDAVKAAHSSGFDYVKAQLYDRDRLVVPTAKTYAQPGVSVPDTQYEDFARQLTYDEWHHVQTYAADVGVGFFFSVFDAEAVGFCEAVGVTRYKIASGDITHKPLIQLVAGTGKEMIMSTGASTADEVWRALRWVFEVNQYPRLQLLACSLVYPTLPADANLRRMETLRGMWPNVGYSDHTFGTGAIVRAEEWGATMVEKHFTITPGVGGDHDFAVTPEQLAGLEYGDGSRIFDGSALLDPTPAEAKARVGARRSMVAANDIVQGDVLNPSDVVMLRPAVGLEPWQADDFLYRSLKVDVPAGVALTADMF